MPAREVASAPLAGRVKYELINHLAKGEIKQTELARRYGVTPAAITEFKRRHKDKIADLIAAKMDGMALLWVADKKKRIAEYQEALERIEGAEAERKAAVLAAMGETLDAEALVSMSEQLKPDPAVIRTQAKLLRNIAEELGQLPARLQIEMGETRVRHVLEGVDLDKL